MSSSVSWYVVAVWYGAGLATARSLVRILPVAAVYQCQLSVPSLRSRLISTSESWGVNGHAMRCTSPVSVVLRLRLVSGWGLRKRRSCALRLRKGLFLLCHKPWSHVCLAIVCRWKIGSCLVWGNFIEQQSSAIKLLDLLHVWHGPKNSLDCSS